MRSLTDALDLTAVVPPHGYRWWYMDALSPDHTLGITIIAFLGASFSPYYRLSRTRLSGDPMAHCSFHVALYGRRVGWTLSETSDVERSPDRLRIGRSTLRIAGDEVILTFDERGMPWPARLRGEVRLTPVLRTALSVPLDPAGQHFWRPYAPSCRAEIAIEGHAPWTAQAYFDGNAGTRPLEADFVRWNWSRALTPKNAAILYDVTTRDGRRIERGLRVRANGVVEPLAPARRVTLPRTGWALPRPTRADGEVLVRRTLTSSPFYARSLLETEIAGLGRVPAMHEALDLDRFTAWPMQAMLPFRTRPSGAFLSAWAKNTRR